MFSRSAKVFCAVAAVELLVFALAAGRVGVLLLLLVVAALSASGSVLLFRQTADMVQRSVEGVVSSDSRAKESDGAAFSDAGLRLAGGALLAFPGLITGLIGGLLLLQPVRSAVRPLLGVRLVALFPAADGASFNDLDRVFRRRDVVDVDAIKRNPDGPSSNSTAQPELH
jgi:UPF0716 protein FxsA